MEETEMTHRATEQPMPPVCELAASIANLALALDAHPLNKHPMCWTHQIDEHWFVAMNGHTEPRRVEGAPNRMGYTVEPFHIALWYNGWLAASFNISGKGFICRGEAANEDTALEAINRKLAALTQQETPQ
jgi:hypothetical protein